jgi:hypothetical protein
MVAIVVEAVEVVARLVVVRVAMVEKMVVLEGGGG